jgi:hypothetical protein
LLGHDFLEPLFGGGATGAGNGFGGMEAEGKLRGKRGVRGEEIEVRS